MRGAGEPTGRRARSRLAGLRGGRGSQCCAAPAGTPPEIIRKISELLVAAGQTDKVRELLKSQGVDDAAMTLEASRKLYADEAPIWLELVSSLGLTPI